MFSKTVFSIARSTFRMYSVMAIFRSSIVLYCNCQVHRDFLITLYILLHVSTFPCHLQGVLYFCFSKLHKFLKFKLLKSQFHIIIIIIIFCGAATQRESWPPHSWGFLDHTQRRTTVGRTPLDEWSARRRDLYLTTHNTHNRQTSMPPVGVEPTISPGKRPKTYALDRAATGTGI